MLRLEKKNTFGALEIAISGVAAQFEDAIQIPGNLERAGMFGLDAACCQYLLTLVESYPSIAMRLSVGPQSIASHLDSLARTLFGFAAITCFDKYIDVHSEKVSAALLNACVAAWTENMDSGDLEKIIRGRSLLLACVSRSSQEYLRPLYATGELRGLQSVRAFKALTSDMVGLCAPGDGLTARQIDAICDLIYELFRNTDEHATLDVDGNLKPEPRFRALSVSYREMPVANSGDYFGNELSIQSYISRIVARSKKIQKIKVLEISVIDNGPGLAARWLAGNASELVSSSASISEELQAVKQCFEKYNTTKLDSGAGQGLTKVVTQLALLNAFLRLRTGRLALYQSFKDSDVPLGKARFHPEQVNSQRSLDKVVGACYTICIPLNVGR